MNSALRAPYTAVLLWTEKLNPQIRIMKEMQNYWLFKIILSKDRKEIKYNSKEIGRIVRTVTDSKRKIQLIQFYTQTNLMRSLKGARNLHAMCDNMSPM